VTDNTEATELDATVVVCMVCTGSLQKTMSMLTYVLHINPHSGIYIMSGNNHSKLARANHNVE